MAAIKIKNSAKVVLISAIFLVAILFLGAGIAKAIPPALPDPSNWAYILTNGPVLQKIRGPLWVNTKSSEPVGFAVPKGKVGIGMSDPQALLDIWGDLRLRPTSVQPITGAGTIYFDETLSKFRCNQDNAWVDCFPGAAGGGAGVAGTQGHWTLETDGTLHPKTDSWNLGIGAIEADAKLTVNGSILFKGGSDGDVCGKILGANAPAMFWLPGKSAFAAGYDTNWNCNNLGSYSALFGMYNKAPGIGSFVAGANNLVSGNYAISLGSNNKAEKDFTAVFGKSNAAQGIGAMAVGESNTAFGDYSLAAGHLTYAFGAYSFASGEYTSSTGQSSVAMGYKSKAIGKESVAMGRETYASGDNAVAMGEYTTSSGSYSVAMGDRAKAGGNASVAMGTQTLAQGSASIAMGDRTRASGDYSVAMGQYSTSSGIASVAMGRGEAAGNYSTAMGYKTAAMGDSSFAIGNQSIANGPSSVAMGEETMALAPSSVAMGYKYINAMPFSLGVGYNTNNRMPGEILLNPIGDSWFMNIGGLGIGITPAAGNALHVAGNTRVDGELSASQIMANEICFSAPPPNGGCRSSWAAPSSIRYKENIKPLENSLQKILSLRGVEFDWNKDMGGAHDIGAIAEEVEKILPEAISWKEGQIEGVNYDKFAPLLIEAVKEQQRQINIQNQDIKSNARAIERLRQEMNALE